MTPKHTFKTVLVLTLAAICTASYAQSSGTNANESAIVSRMPEFPGGDSAFHKYITDNLKYPEEAKEKGLSVRVCQNGHQESNAADHLRFHTLCQLNLKWIKNRKTILYM